MNTYFQSFANEILAKFSRINELTSHSASIGSYRETLIRQYLSNFLSKRYSVKTGFVYDSSNEKCSKQTDILIIDEFQSAPFLFSEGEFVIARPEAVVLGIEIKSNLNASSFNQAIENCLSFKEILPKKTFSIFAFNTTDNVREIAANWYKKIDRKFDSIALYPNTIYCMNIGSFVTVPPKFATEWGQYFQVPLNDCPYPESMVLTSFLADIVKIIDISNGSSSNPYSDFGIKGMMYPNCMRFGKGKVAGEIIVAGN